jgi:predicted metal-binding protein
VNETLYVCQTCDRDQDRPAGAPSRGLVLMETLALSAQGSDKQVRMRRVECLSGCPNPCNAALRAQGKTWMRLSRLTPLDAVAVLQLTKLYAESPDGCVAAEAIPARLRAKVSQCRVEIPTIDSELTLKER